MKPSLPQRKAANVNVSPVGSASGGNNSAAPARRSAQPFGSVDKSVYQRPSAPISPTSSPINDKDAGNGPGNVRNRGPNSGGVGVWAGGAD